MNVSLSYADNVAGVKPYHNAICAPAILHRDGEPDTPLSLEIANTPESMAQGLMFREFLTPDGGMLFIFPQPQIIHFWMKNTFIHLDMLFIAGDGTIMGLHEMAKPHDTTIISSPDRALYAIELRGGTIDRLNIKAGDYITGLNIISGR